MKLKPIYIYPAVIVIIVAVLFFTSGSDDIENNVPQSSQQSMPDDDIHKGMGQMSEAQPGKGNVKSEVYEQMEAMKKKIDASPSDTTTMLEYADLLYAAHRQSEAQTYYEKILSLDGNRTDILTKLTAIYYNKQDFQAAKEINDKIISIDPNDLFAKYNKGAIAVSLGDRETARKEWTELVEKFPNSEAGVTAKRALERL